ncbi:MAG TPA: hypothetical protein VGM19_13570 [Armatimonadota bacterium]|jgi:Na+/glutamate symporter
MTDISRLLASLAGVLLGGGLGAAAYYELFKYYEKIGSSMLSFPLAVLLIGGGVIGGGYLGLLLISKVQRKRRAAQKAAGKKFTSKKKGRK